MKRFLIAIAAICLPLVPAHATDHHKQRVVQQRVVVPFAVPLAVPVAVASPVQYTNQVIPYSDPPKSAEDLLLDKLAALVAAKLQNGEVKAAAPKPTMFSQKCAACHAKNKVEEFLSLDALDQDHRLKAIKAVVSEKMPKGKQKLTPNEVGQLMLELSTIPKPEPVKANADAPPEPQPEGETE